jgi:anti-sigma factor RsiW
MSGICFDETLYAMFVDDEAAPDQRREIEMHLDTCPACRKIIRALEAENEQLRKAFAWNHPTPDLIPAIMGKRDSAASPSEIQKAIVAKSGKSDWRQVFQWGLATAASFLVIGFLFLFLLSPHPAPPDPETSEKKVMLCSASVAGNEAESHIYEERNQDTQFIWLEKEQ